MATNAPLEAATITRLLGDESPRLLAYQKAWKAYYGDWPDSLNTKPGQPNDNVKLNPCRTIVDKGAFYLFGNDIKFSIEQANIQGNTLSEKPKADDDQTLWLSALWRKQQQQSILTKLAINGGVCGQAYVKIVPGDPFPRLLVIDPSTVTVVTDPDDYQTVWGYRIQYDSTDPKTGRPIIVRQLITKNMPEGLSWTITDQVTDTAFGAGLVQGFGTSNWRTINVTEWPFAWAPIADCQNLPSPNQYYGSPDLTREVIHTAALLNGNLSNRNRVVRLKGHPITWGKGAGSNQIDFSPENFILMRSDNGELNHLEMKGDMSPTKQLYDDLLHALYQQAHIPPIALGELTTFGNISGLALKIAYGPIMDITSVKRRLYGYMLEDINSRLVELQFGKAGVSTVIHWPDIVPTDDLAEGQMYQVHQTLGVSNDTILSRLGYDAQFELGKRKAEVAAGEAPPIAAQPSLARGEGLPGDNRTPANKSKTPDSRARRSADRAKSDGAN